MARLAVVPLSIVMTVLAPTVGYPNAMVTPISFLWVLSGSSATPSEKLGSYVPDCTGPTGPLSALTKTLATSPIDREPVESPKFADQSEPLAIVLRVRDTAGVPDDVLAKAQTDITRIYREAGVQILWPTTESLSAESNAFRQSALTVAVVTLHQAKRMTPAVAAGHLGFAPSTPEGDGRLVYVIYDRVERLTGGNGLRRSSVLAIAIAHEIGHLLLPSNGHSLTGLMRAEWTRAELDVAQRELTFFTTRQGALLRNRISASPYRLTGDRIHTYLCHGHLSTR